ncbi:hypothetical protein [Vibrio sp. 10N.261.55.A7]|uniref:hypothetical protein n=1 Tax=Vibrio sp. 10N.261.55.A7 TaxID=1880851 RepID=UPI001055CB3C|nr:hypothetical protein [Vibrio sp. 10N.261.55.A7]
MNLNRSSLSAVFLFKSLNFLTGFLFDTNCIPVFISMDPAATAQAIPRLPRTALSIFMLSTPLFDYLPHWQ